MQQPEEAESNSPKSPKEKSPWQTIVQHKTSEDHPSQIEDIGEETTTQLRISAKERKQSPRYANTIIAEEDNVKEPSTFEEAYKVTDGESQCKNKFKL